MEDREYTQPYHEFQLMGDDACKPPCKYYVDIYRSRLSRRGFKTIASHFGRVPTGMRNALVSWSMGKAWDGLWETAQLPKDFYTTHNDELRYFEDGQQDSYRPMSEAAQNPQLPVLYIYGSSGQAFPIAEYDRSNNVLAVYCDLFHAKSVAGEILMDDLLAFVEENSGIRGMDESSLMSLIDPMGFSKLYVYNNRRLFELRLMRPKAKSVLHGLSKEIDEKRKGLESSYKATIASIKAQHDRDIGRIRANHERQLMQFRQLCPMPMVPYEWSVFSGVGDLCRVQVSVPITITVSEAYWGNRRLLFRKPIAMVGYILFGLGWDYNGRRYRISYGSLRRGPRPVDLCWISPHTNTESICLGEAKGKVWGTYVGFDNFVPELQSKVSIIKDTLATVNSNSLLVWRGLDPEFKEVERFTSAFKSGAVDYTDAYLRAHKLEKLLYVPRSSGLKGERVSKEERNSTVLSVSDDLPTPTDDHRGEPEDGEQEEEEPEEEPEEEAPEPETVLHA